MIIVILLVSIFTINSTMANNSNPIKPDKVLRSEIVSLIGNSIPIKVNKEINTEIFFVVNNKNEVIIVSMDSNNKGLDDFIKSTLNYKKLFTKTAKKGELYAFNLKVLKPY